jgi:tight adherence protein B
VNVLLALVVGCGAGLGLVLVAFGLTGRNVLPPRRAARNGARAAIRVRALGVALLVGIVVTAITHWPVGGLLAGFASFTLPGVLGGRVARDGAVARTEAIASWTEMVRDSIVAASGLEEAIVATGPIAPDAIRAEVSLLVSRLGHASLPDALAAFGEELQHPSADLVVAALTIAARMEASDLSSLLSRLAESIRGEARMRIRVEVGRARVRTATKVIVGVVAATVTFLAAMNREYLAAYDTPLGQVVLLVVAAIFATGGWLLVKMAGLELPERFRARTREAIG